MNNLLKTLIQIVLDLFFNFYAYQNKEEKVIDLKPITKEDLLKNRDKLYPNEYNSTISDNLDKLLIVLNKLQNHYGKQFIINSGWRPAEINSNTKGAASHSKHMEGLAADIHDTDGKIMEWTLSNLHLMKELGVYMEDWRWTPTWTHYQIVPPKSQKRIFIPSTAAPLSPNKWSGKYESDSN